MKVLTDVGSRGMEAGANIVPKWTLREAVPEEWEVVRVEKEWVLEEGWDVGCIMAVGKAGLRNVHSPGLL